MSNLLHTTSYLQVLDEAKLMIHKYQLDDAQVSKLQRNIENFKVITPLVGAFSSGKSSLVNRLLESNLLPVAITPETAVPAEITFGLTERIVVVDKHTGSERQITVHDFQETNFNPDTTELIKIELNHPFLQEIKHVIIADIPGLDSGIAVHNFSIDHYLPNSLAYIVTIDAESGLRNSVMIFLEELGQFETKPVFVAITKADKKIDSDLQAIQADVQDKISRVLKVNDFGIATVSSAKNQIEPVKQYLREIQSQSGDIFITTNRPKILEQLRQLERYLLTRLDKKDFSLEDLDEQARKLQHALRRHRF